MLMGVTSWELGVLRVPLIMVPDIYVPWVIICVRLGPSTLGDYVHVRVPKTPGVTLVSQARVLHKKPHVSCCDCCMGVCNGSMVEYSCHSSIRQKYSVQNKIVMHGKAGLSRIELYSTRVSWIQLCKGKLNPLYSIMVYETYEHT
jgi:hypothetical protein